MSIRSFLKISCLFVLLTSCGFAFAEQTLYLDKITFTGLQHLSQTDLDKAVSIKAGAPFEQEMIQLIQNQLQAYLIKKGYYFSQVTPHDLIPAADNKVELIFHIEEGYDGYLSDLRFTGNKYFSADKLKQVLVLPPPERIRLTDLPAIMNQTLNLYTSRGYVFAQVELDTLALNEQHLQAVIKIDEGPLFRPQKYIFSGNQITKNNTLLKISGLSQTKIFTPDVLTQAENRILQKPYIKSCSIIPLDASTLEIEIEEAKMTKIEGVLGLNTDPQSSKQNLAGWINLQFLNLGGTDRSLLLNWQKTKVDYQLLKLSYHESGLRQYPFAGDLSFQNVQQKDRWNSVKAELSVYYYYLKHKFGSAFSTENLYPEAGANEDVTKSKYYDLSGFWEYDAADYSPNPTKGSKIRLQAGWHYRDNDNGEKTIPVTEIDTAFWFTLAKRFVYSPALHYREISDREAADYEQYKLGGFGTVRGYLEDTFSGWRTGWINNEFNYLLSRDSRLFTFLDYGVWQSGKEDLSKPIMGTGAGIAVKTRVGIISISYALSISEGRIAGLSSGMLHMGLISSL